jgi:hypothetical protein
MHSRLFFAALPIAVTFAAALFAISGCTRSGVPLKPAVEAAPPRLTHCPANREVVDIKASTDPFTRRKQMETLKAKLAIDGTIVRLGPDVDLDFSERLPGVADLPADFLPISFGQCVTLTSVSAFTGAGRTRLAAGGIMRDTVGQIPAPGHEAPGAGAGSTEARSPRTRGPVLRYGKHRVTGTSGTFLEIRCSDDNKLPHDGARISGIRLYGPFFGQQWELDVGIRIIRCVDVDITNMEIAGWGGDGISVQDDPGPDHEPESNAPGGRIMNPGQIRIHDSFFHHNQHPNLGGVACQGGSAEGYGVNVGHGAWAQISRNVFDFNRHAIAAAGDTGGYMAEQNLVLKGGGFHGTPCNTYTHSFDVHGTGCWWSSNLCGDAGIQFWYLDNAFQYSKDNDIKIRGKPAIQAIIDGNVFARADMDDAVNLYTEENVVKGPASFSDSFGNYGVCDFDGDGVDDLFLPTGATWWFSSFGEFQWSYLNAKKERMDQVRLGYFDNDLRCDVLAEHNGQWAISSGGTSDWRPLGAFGTALSEVQFGRFDPNQRDHRPGVTLRTTHAFRRAPDGQWFVTPLSHPDWQPVQSSSLPMSQLRFGDFTGDGVTDVLAVMGGRWAISESATGTWRRLNPTLGAPVGNLFIANMDPDDNVDDILRLDRQTVRIGSSNPPVNRTTLTWWRSRNGTEPWTQWKQHVFVYPVSPETVIPGYGFAGRFGAAPGGGTLVIDPERRGHFYSAAEIATGAAPDWNSLFSY